MKTETGPRVAIVGVSGAVGMEFLKVLKQRDFPYRGMKMLASKRSAGKEVKFDGDTYVIEELTEASFDDVDIALFSAGGSISKKFGPLAAEKGVVVVDNSSAFRMTEGVPLVIPEINPDHMAHIKLGSGKGAIIANPNCSTIIALMAVTPLHRHKAVKRMVASTYQAASGAGQAAMEELVQQTREVLDGKPVTQEIFPFQYAFNCFSHNSPLDVELGYNEEEMKLTKETAKIWADDKPRISGMCIRVPVMRAHAESINLEFYEDFDWQEAKDVLSKAPGIKVLDDRANNRFPMPLDATGGDEVWVGRIRQDISQEGKRGLDIFIAGDQIRKGAALNAVQVAELLVK
ncbi:unnamed protein product [Pedinophyceae sp. YPF-701]|nr:unnamed protein product [Pedinophyceae sp. YPF-701]